MEMWTGRWTHRPGTQDQAAGGLTAVVCTCGLGVRRDRIRAGRGPWTELGGLNLGGDG